MRKLLVVAATTAVMLGASVGMALADPGLNDIFPHRHFINGKEVGPRICDHPTNPVMQEAFNQFHANHHNHNVTGGIGPIAPGINDTQGPRLTPGNC